MREFPSILLSEASIASADASAIVNSNISVVNFLRHSEVGDNELHPDALASYCVDYYYTTLQEEGLPAFIHKTKWDNDIIEIIHAALLAMNAPLHLEYFEKQIRRVKGFSKVKFTKFLQADLGKDTANAALLDDKTHQDITEDLRAINGNWLQNHPDTQIVSIEEMQDIITEFLSTEQEED
ncbi:MAG: hypothetical protein LBI72_04720 [Flavobacteriaceae bacterium]|jgi:hypothetical protein|nr:hypothetical protein [Flavobacteriaceae bacterium]